MRSVYGLLLSIPLAAAAVPHALAHDSCKRLECEKTRQKIAKIEAKMRVGYTVKAGERMQGELRRLRRYRSSVCR